MEIKSVTREKKKEIKKADLRKAVIKIILCYDKEWERDFPTGQYYLIRFKEDTVKSCYDGNYMECTPCPGHLDINEWLDEVAYLPKWYGEEN